MALLELILAEGAVNGLLGLTFWKAKDRAETQAALGKWKLDGEPVPIFDQYMARMAGTLPEKERKRADMVIKGLRGFVNLKAFEHVVVGAMNPNSELRRRLPFLEKLGGWAGKVKR
jgi:hypothetical protein